MCISRLATASFLRGLIPWYDSLFRVSSKSFRGRKSDSDTTPIPSESDAAVHGPPPSFDATDFFMVDLDGSIRSPSPSSPKRESSVFEEGVFVYRDKEGTTFVFDGMTVNEFSSPRPASADGSLAPFVLHNSHFDSTTEGPPVVASRDSSFEDLGRAASSDSEPDIVSSEPGDLISMPSLPLVPEVGEEESETSTTTEAVETVTQSRPALTPDQLEYIRNIYGIGYGARPRIRYPFAPFPAYLPLSYHLAHQRKPTTGAAEGGDVDGGYYVLPPADEAQPPPAIAFPSLLPPLFLLGRLPVSTTLAPSSIIL